MATDYSSTWGQLMNNLGKIEAALPDMHGDDLIDLRSALDDLTTAIDNEEKARR